MEYDDIVIYGVEAGNDIAFMAGCRVPLAGHDDAAGRAWFPVDHIAAQRSPGAGIHDLCQVTVEERQDSLGFRIAETAVEFHDFRAIGGNHQSGIQTALIGNAFFCKALDDRNENRVVYDLDQFRCQYRCRGIGTHAARVGAFVVIEDALVVLGRDHGYNRLAIDKCQEAGFFADHAFFNDDTAAGSAKDMVFHHSVHSIDGFFHGLRHDNALAGCQSIGLYDDRSSHFMDIFFCRITIGKRRIGCCRHMILFHEILGEYLGAFHLGCCLIGAKNGNPLFLAHVSNAFCQGDFRTYDDHVYAFFYSKISNTVQFFYPDGHTFRHVCHGITAGQGIQLFYAWALG